jgi:hypothetical protein
VVLCIIGAYQLELSRREERLIVKTLAQLATAEPGDNLPFVQFRYSLVCVFSVRMVRFPLAASA